MILDNGICCIYRPDGSSRTDSPIDGLTAIYEDYFAAMYYDAAALGDGFTRKIRIHRSDVQVHDVAEIDGVYSEVTRVYHGYDDKSGMEISDITLAGGADYFQRLLLYPAKVTVDSYGTQTVTHDADNVKGVWCTHGIIETQEYYAAYSAGVTLSARFDVWSIDYAAHMCASCNGALYAVKRSQRDGCKTALYCEVVTKWPESTA